MEENFNTISEDTITKVSYLFNILNMLEIAIFCNDLKDIDIEDFLFNGNPLEEKSSVLLKLERTNIEQKTYYISDFEKLNALKDILNKAKINYYHWCSNNEDFNENIAKIDEMLAYIDLLLLDNEKNLCGNGRILKK